MLETQGFKKLDLCMVWIPCSGNRTEVSKLTEMLEQSSNFISVSKSMWEIEINHKFPLSEELLAPVLPERI